MKFVTSLFVVVFLFAHDNFCHSATITKSEPNDSLLQAQHIDSYFSKGSNADILNAATVPWVSIQATGNDTYDYYTFTVPTAGSVGVFDIDHGMNVGGSIDTELALWRVNADGTYTVLAENDDWDHSAGAAGSVHDFDAFISHVFDRPGRYVVGVAKYSASAGPAGWNSGSQIPHVGATYTLQASIQGHVASGPAGAVLSLLTPALPVIPHVAGDPIGHEADTTERVSAYATILGMQNGSMSPGQGRRDQYMVRANRDGAGYENGTLVISHLLDNAWGDALNVAGGFNTVYNRSPGPDANGVFEVVSANDELGTTRGTTNQRCYYFSYDSLNDWNNGAITLKRWIDYLERIQIMYGRIGRLTIYAHGSPDRVTLSDGAVLTLESITYDSMVINQLARLRNILANGAHILLFSCQAAQNGTNFIQRLANLTNATVHANSNYSGDISDNVDWTLDAVATPLYSSSWTPELALEEINQLAASIVGVNWNSGYYRFDSSYISYRNWPSWSIDGYHPGVDMQNTSAAWGRKVYSPVAGEVADSYFISGVGQVVSIRLPSREVEPNRYFLFVHLDPDSVSGLATGQLVGFGDLVGAYDSSQNHVHIEGTTRASASRTGSASNSNDVRQDNTDVTLEQVNDHINRRVKVVVGSTAFSLENPALAAAENRKARGLGDPGNILATARALGHLDVGAREVYNKIGEDTPSGEDLIDLYAFTLPVARDVAARLTFPDTGTDVDIELLDATGATISSLTRSMDQFQEGVNLNDKLEGRLNAGNYYIKVSAPSASADTIYRLRLYSE